MTTWTVALLAATALHAGFQATVTLLVYPALADVARSVGAGDGQTGDGQTGDWQTAHASHSRRIVGLVAVVYGAAVLACAWALVSAPTSVGVVVAAAGTAGAVLVTATLAAPTHGRLTDGPDKQLVRRLLVADRARLALALVAFVGAVLHALSPG